MNTWIPSHQFSGDYIIEQNETEIESLPNDVFRETGLSIACQQAGFLLFAAVDEGPDWSYPTITVGCSSGRYSISTAELTNRGVSRLAHQLKLDPAKASS